MRTAKEVLLDHLNKAKLGQVQEDIAENYAPDMIILSCHGRYEGHQSLNPDQARIYL